MHPYEGSVNVWSTLKLKGPEVAHQEHNLFGACIGELGQGFDRSLTLTETNLRESWRVPGGFKLAIRSISWVVFGGSRGDHRQIIENSAYALLTEEGSRFDISTVLIRSGVQPISFDESDEPGACYGWQSFPGGFDLPWNTRFKIGLSIGKCPLISGPVLVRCTLTGGITLPLG